jgi:hypothetical protein
MIVFSPLAQQDLSLQRYLFAASSTLCAAVKLDTQQPLFYSLSIARQIFIKRILFCTKLMRAGFEVIVPSDDLLSS